MAEEKQRWETIFKALLSGVPGSTVSVPVPNRKTMSFEVPVARWGELPERCTRIVAEGRCTFPRRWAKGPDQGNFRVIIEKGLGDALESGGWIEQDDWTRYSFGNLDYQLERGVSRTEIILFPTAVFRPSRIRMEAFQ